MNIQLLKELQRIEAGYPNLKAFEFYYFSLLAYSQPKVPFDDFIMFISSVTFLEKQGLIKGDERLDLLTRNFMRYVDD